MTTSKLPHQLLQIVACAFAALVAFAPAARAQSADQAPAHVDFVEGGATLEREGQADPVAPGMPFVPGDTVRTDGGRVEILFPDGTALDVDEYTTLDLQSPTLLRVTGGRVLLTVTGSNNPAAAVRYQVDTPVASANTDGPGQFRIAILSSPSGLETELAVLRGAGSLTTERGSVAVFAGQRSLARDNDAPMYAQTFNSARFDAFDRWAAMRRDARTGTPASAQYLPDSLRLYGSYFERNGGWRYEAPYGYVWYPVVDIGWRPYYNGYWAPVRGYGWTWIGYDAWSWPTHHYGRWGHVHDQWFWIPGQQFSVAWVSWGAAPGYVSWCPLGFDNRPVFAVSIGVNDWWNGWTVVPRTHFGWYSTPRWAVAGHRLPSTTPFLQTGAPTPATYAIPRSVVVDAGRPAGVAVPRSAAGRQVPVAGQQITAQPPLVDRSAVPRGNTRAPDADSRTTIGGSPAPTGGDWRLPAGDGGSPAATRQPSVDRRFRAPDGSTVTIDRTVPTAERREQAEIWLKQPLNGNGAAPARSPDTSRAYQRIPGTYTTPTPQSTTPTSSTPSAAPRWRTYSGAADPARSVPSSPSAVNPRDDTSRTAAPRWQTYSAPGAVPRVPTPEREAAPPGRSYGAPARSYSPADQAPATRWYSPPRSTQPTPPPSSQPAPAPSYQPAPVYRVPPTAAPRSAAPTAAPAPAADSGSSGGGGGAARSGSSGGARQRQP